MSTAPRVAPAQRDVLAPLHWLYQQQLGRVAGWIIVAAGMLLLAWAWVDLVRACTRILLPIAVLGAIVLMIGGVIQNFNGFTTVTTLTGGTRTATLSAGRTARTAPAASTSTPATTA